MTFQEFHGDVYNKHYKIVMALTTKSILLLAYTGGVLLTVRNAIHIEKTEMTTRKEFNRACKNKFSSYLSLNNAIAMRANKSGKAVYIIMVVCENSHTMHAI